MHNKLIPRSAAATGGLYRLIRRAGCAAGAAWYEPERLTPFGGGLTERVLMAGAEIGRATFGHGWEFREAVLYLPSYHPCCTISPIFISCGFSWNFT